MPKRTRVAKYIYEDASGLVGRVYVTGHRPADLRFPPKTPLADIRRAMDRRRAQMHAMTPVPIGPAPGTVAEIVAAYVAPLGPTMAETDERGRLGAWVTACGTEPFATLTKGQLQDIRDGWLKAGTAPSTVSKRISSLRKVARKIADATHDETPPHAIELIKRPRPVRSGEIRARPLALVERVLANLPDWNQNLGRPSQTKARLAVWAWTGQNPAQLQHLRVEHVRWTTSPPQLYVQPRRKGQGVDAGWVPLLPQAVAALREFFARDCGGPWDKGTLLRAFKRARTKTQRQLKAEHRHHEAAQLAGMLPKDLRHSIGTALLEASGDVFAVKEFLRHADIKTTMLYTTGASSANTQAAVAALRAVTLDSPPPSPALGRRATKTPPCLPQGFATKTPHKTGRKSPNRHAPPQDATASNPHTP